MTATFEESAMETATLASASRRAEKTCCSTVTFCLDADLEQIWPHRHLDVVSAMSPGVGT